MKFDLAGGLNFPELIKQLPHINAQLAMWLTSDTPSLQKPLERLIGVGGKRLRPAMTLAVVASQGKAVSEDVIKAASSIELLHLASLIHDDIMDEADRRWGVATVNRIEGSSRALLVGDYVLAQAYAQAASVSQPVAAAIAQAFAALCDGQARELADQYNLARTIENYTETIRGKTAALFVAACKVGAVCAEVSPEHTQVFVNYGEQFGMAFQIIDDVLDFVSTEKLLGKPVGNDVREGNYTLPLILLAKTDQKYAERLVVKNQPASKELITTLVNSGMIQKALEEAEKYCQNAALALARVEPSAVTKGLKHLPQTYLTWVRQNLVDPSYGL